MRYLKEVIANDTPYEIYQVSEFSGSELTGTYRVIGCFFKESDADEYIEFLKQKTQTI